MTTAIFDVEQVYLVSNQGENLNITVEFVSDELIQHPRNHSVEEWLGTMYTVNDKYKLGENTFDADDIYDMNQEQAFEEIVGKPSDYIYLPLYVYNHDNLTISTTPFSCSWDSSFVGFIAVSKEQVRKEYGKTRISKQLQERVETYLRNEVSTLDEYMQGNNFGIVVRHYDDEGNQMHEESIMGCYGMDEAIETASEYTGISAEEIKCAIDNEVLYEQPLNNSPTYSKEDWNADDWRVENVNYIVGDDGTIPTYETLQPIANANGGVFPVGTAVEVVNVTQNYLAGQLFKTTYNLLFKFKKGGQQCQVLQTGFDEEIFDVLNQTGWGKPIFDNSNDCCSDLE